MTKEAELMKVEIKQSIRDSIALFIRAGGSRDEALEVVDSCLGRSVKESSSCPTYEF